MAKKALAKAPADQIQRLMAALDLEANPDQQMGAVRDAFGDATPRHFERLRGPIDTGSMGRWKRELTSDDIRAFERIAGRTLRDQGYGPDTPTS